MPTYEYICPLCRTTLSDHKSFTDYDPTYRPQCPTCSNFMRRNYTPPAHRPSFQPHFNAAAGKYVNSKRELQTAFDRASEAATERSGMEHRFVMHDPRDPDMKQHLGVTEQGMDETHRRRRAEGLDQRKTFG